MQKIYHRLLTILAVLTGTVAFAQNPDVSATYSGATICSGQSATFSVEVNKNGSALATPFTVYYNLNGGSARTQNFTAFGTRNITINNVTVETTLTVDSIKDASNKFVINGVDATITSGQINPRPSKNSFSIQNNQVAEGDDFVFNHNFNGTAPYTLTIEVDNVVKTLNVPNSVGSVALNEAGINDVVGTYQIDYVKISDANGCVSNNPAEFVGNVTVNPKPEVVAYTYKNGPNGGSALSNTYCEGDDVKIDVEFTGNGSITGTYDVYFFEGVNSTQRITNGTATPANLGGKLIATLTIGTATLSNDVDSIRVDFTKVTSNLGGGVTVENNDPMDSTDFVSGAPDIYQERLVTSTTLNDAGNVAINEICEEAELNLDVVLANTQGAATFNYTFNGAAFGPINDIAGDDVSNLEGFGQYQVAATNNIVITQIQDEVCTYTPSVNHLDQVFVNSKPTVTFTGANALCENDIYTLGVQYNGAPNFDFTYRINGGAVNYTFPTAVNTTNGTITIDPNNYDGLGSSLSTGVTYTITAVELTDNNSCTSNEAFLNEDISFLYKARPTAALSFDAPTEICSGETAILAFNLTGTAPFTITLDSISNVNGGGAQFRGQVTYTVNATNGTVNLTPNVSASTVYTYDVREIQDADACGNTFASGVVSTANDLTVYPNPSVVSISQNIDSVCFNNRNDLEFTVDAQGSGDYVVRGTLVDDNGDNYTFEYANGGLGSPFTFTLNTAINSAPPFDALGNGRSYTINFTEIEDLRNTGSPADDCTSPLTNQFSAFVFSRPNVDAFDIVSSDNIAVPVDDICFGGDAKLLFDIDAFGRTTITVNRTSAVNPALNGTINVVYPGLDAGPRSVNYPTQEYLVSPLDSVSYTVVNIQSQIGTLTCSRTEALGPEDLNVNDIPEYELSIDKSELCNDGVNNTVDVTVTLTGGDDANGFNFDIVNGGVTTSSSINNPATSVTETITLTDSSFIFIRNMLGQTAPTCAGEDDSVFVNVNQLPDVVLLTPDTFICQGNQAGYRVSLTGVAPFTIDLFSESAPAVGNATSVTVLNAEAGNYVNNREVFIPVSGIATEDDTAFTITAVSDAVCTNTAPTGDNDRVIIVINRNPTATIISPSAVCFGQNASLGLQVSGGNNNDFGLSKEIDLDYTIQYKNGGVFSTGTFTSVSTIIGNRATPETFNLNRDTTFIVTSISDATFGCIGVDGQSFDVMVLDELTASISGNDTICNGDDMELTVSLPDGFQYELEFTVNGANETRTNVQNGDILTFTTGGGLANDTVILNTVAYQTGLACLTTINDTVSSFEQAIPAADISINQNDIQVCSGNDLIFTVDVTAGTGNVFVDYQSTTGSITGTVSGLAGNTINVVESGVAPGSYTFEIVRVYTNSDNGECIGNAGATQAQATVRNNPQVSFLPNKVNVCDNENVIFKGSFTPAATSAATQFSVVYEINGEGDQTAVFEPGIGDDELIISRVGSYTIEFKSITEVDGNGVNCTNPLAQTFNINVNPRPSVVFTGDASICEQQSTQLSLDFSGTAPYDVTISNFGTFTASNDTVITVTPSTTTVYEVTNLTDASGAGCAGATTNPQVTVTVTEKPDVVFNLSDNPICAGQTVDMELTFVGGTNPDFTVQYQVNNTAPITHNTASSGGALTISLPAFNQDASLKILRVTDESSPSCVFTESLTQNLVVREVPVAELTASKTEVCEGENVQVTLEIEGRAGSQIEYEVQDELANIIQSGTTPAGSVINLPQLTNLTTDKTISVTTLRYADGTPACNSAIESVFINVNPQPTVDLIGGGIYCEGEAIPYTIDYTSGDGDIFVKLRSVKTGQVLNQNDIQGASKQYLWTPNDTGAVDLEVISITSVSGTGNICQNTVNLPAALGYQVRPNPSADINANQFTIVEGGEAKLIFSGTGYVGAGAGQVFIDYTANGTPVNPSASLDGAPQYPDTSLVTVSPTTTTTYQITSVRQNSGAVNGECAVTSTDNVTITVEEDITAAISGDANICLGESVQLFFSFANPVPQYDVIIEDVGTGTTGNLDTLFNVSDNTAITYVPKRAGSVEFVIFKVTDDIGNETSDPNEFAGRATFEVAESKIVTLSGDNIVCEGQPGVFTVTMEGSGEFTVPFEITPSGSQRIFTASENDSPSQRTVLAGELRLGVNTINFDGLVTNSLNNACPIEQKGSATITVKPTPSADFIFTPVEPCEGSNVQVFLDAAPDSVYNVTYSQDFGSGLITKTVNGVQDNALLENFTTSVNGTFTIRSIGYADAPACTNNTLVQKTLNVKSAPVVAFKSQDAQICNGQELDLVVRVSGVDKYPVEFTYNDGTKDSTITFVNNLGLLDTIITVAPTTTTTYTLVSVSDANVPSCNGSVSIGEEDVTVTVGSPLILNEFRLLDDTICAGENVSYVVDVNGDMPMTAFFSGSEGSFTKLLNSTGANIFTITPSADLSLTLDKIVDNFNCEKVFNQTETTQRIANPTLSFTANKTTLCLGDSVRLRVTVNAEDTVTALFRDPNFAAGGIDTTYILIPGTQFVWLKPKQAGQPVVVTVEEVAYFRPRGGCTSEDVQQQPFNVIANPTASLTVGGDKDTTVCQGAIIPLDFVATGSGNKTVFFESSAGASGFITIPAGSTMGTKNVATGAATGLIKYYITSVSADGGANCTTNGMDTVYVQVSPTPRVEITATNNPRCLNGPNSVITFNFTGNGPFVFDYTDGTNTFTRTASVDNDGDGRLDVRVTVAPGTTTTYCVTRIADATNPNACVSTAANCLTIRVNQQPEAELFNGNDEICFGESVTLNYFLRGRAPIDVRFTYTGTAAGQPNVNGDTLIENLGTGLQTLTLNLPAPRNYIITIDSIADNNKPVCTSGATVGFAEVVVNPIPTVNSFTLDNNRLCEGESARINITPGTFSGDYPFQIRYLANGTAVTDTITQTESFIMVSPSETTTYRLLSIKNIATGCDSVYAPSNPFVQTLEIFDNPTIDFQIDPSNICVGESFNLDVRLTGTPNFVFDVFVNGNLFATNQSVSVIDEDVNNPGEYIKTFTYPGAPLAPAGFNRSFVTIRNVRDNSQAVNGTLNNCVTNPTDTAFFQVNPQATANFNNTATLTICEGEQVDMPITVTGSGEVFAEIEVYRVSDNTLIRTDIVSELASVGSVIYSDSPTFNVRYEIANVYSETGGVTCPGVAGNSKSINVRNTPKVAISVNSETICEDEQVEVTYTLTGQGPFDFVRTYIEGTNPADVREFFNVSGTVTEFITLTDTTVLYVDSIIRRQTPQCFNTDSVGKRVNVNPKATATMLVADTSFCQGETPGFRVALEGEGAITILYRRMPSGPIQTYTNFEGTYFIPVAQTAGTTGRWQVISVDDESNPRCVAPSGTGFTDISVVRTPSARIAGEFEICEGANAAVNLVLQGQPDDSLIVYYSDKFDATGAGITGTYANYPGNYGVLISSVDTTSFLTVDSVRYVNFGCTVTADQFATVDTAKIFVRPSPEVNITTPSVDICKFEDASFTFNFPFPGPYNVSYSINGGSTLTDVDINDGYTVTEPMAGDTVKLVITSLVYRDIPQCVNEDADSLTIFVNDSLQVTIVDTLCNDVASGYRFVVDITGGKSDSYVFNGPGGPVTLEGPRDTLPELPNGAYNFTVEDMSGCPGTTFTGTYNCDCISQSGDFTNTTDTILVCEDQIAIANLLYDNTNEVLDANDTSLFILHDNSGATLGTVFAVNTSAAFAKNTLLTNTVYYISAIVGDADATVSNGFDPNDRCLSVSPGVPVMFLDRSSLEIELLPNDSGFLCRDNLLPYRFKFTSPNGGNFAVTWNDGTGPDRSDNFVGSVDVDLLSNAPVTVNGNIDIISFIDTDNGNSCFSVLNDNEPYTLSNLPDASYIADDLTPCGDELIEDAQVVTFTANAAGNFAYDWTFTNATPETGDEQVEQVQWNVDGNQLVRLRVTNQFGCIDSTDQNIAVTIATKPVIDDANFTKLCIDTTVTFTASNLNAGNSDQIDWKVDGVTQQSSASNSFTAPTFTEKREYQIVVINSFNGCTASDTFKRVVIGPEADIVLIKDSICVEDNLTLRLENIEDVSRADWTVNGTSSLTKSSATSPFTTAFKIPEGFPNGDVVDVSVEIRSPEGCVTTRELLNVTVFDVSVTIDHEVPLQEGPNAPAEYCNGYRDSAFIAAIPAPVGNNLTYSWNFGRGEKILTGANPPAQVLNQVGFTSIVLTATDEFGCVDVDSVQFEIKPRPTIDIVTSLGQDTICSGNAPVTIEGLGINPSLPNVQWTWTPDPGIIAGANQRVATLGVLSEGVHPFELIGRDNNFCYDTASIDVYSFDLEDPGTIAKFRDLDTTFALGYELPVDYALGNAAYRYEWSPTDGVEFPNFGITDILTLEDRVYTLTVDDIYGCFDERFVFVDIQLIRQYTLDVPDAFTPNGDGINEVIYPDGWALDEVLEFNVYNKYGNQIWSGTGTKEEAGWDGTYKGKPQPAGSYVYKVVVKTLLGRQEVASGEFLLIR